MFLCLLLRVHVAPASTCCLRKQPCLFELHSELITVRFNWTNCNLQIVRKLACFPPFTLCYKWMLHRIDGKKQRIVLNVGVA